MKLSKKSRDALRGIEAAKKSYEHKVSNARQCSMEMSGLLSKATPPIAFWNGENTTHEDEDNVEWEVGFDWWNGRRQLLARRYGLETEVKPLDEATGHVVLSWYRGLDSFLEDVRLRMKYEVESY
jgi:hypothetical protein